MPDDKAEKIALFRYGLIAPLVLETLPRGTPPRKPCCELTNLRIDLPSGVAPGRSPRPRRRAGSVTDRHSRTLEQISGVLLFADTHQGGAVPERRPWVFNVKIAAGVPYFPAAKPGIP